jgi:murein DD-endopeptidase MepM/ murein hydrolase activator NlpD
VGTPIVAARAGTVVATRHHFSDGNDLDLHENYAMIRHEDGSIARCIHLRRDGVLVAPGQAVRQGERIGFSGNTGQTGGPHLHFDVQSCGPNLPPAYNQLPCGMTLPVNFRNTEPHRCGLEAGRRWKALPR